MFRYFSYPGVARSPWPVLLSIGAQFGTYGTEESYRSQVLLVHGSKAKATLVLPCQPVGLTQTVTTSV